MGILGPLAAKRGGSMAGKVTFEIRKRPIWRKVIKKIHWRK